ncbi:tRNA uridine-5-carboxymethylaminomethyl(34) synthesis GTPase MnmE, partial [bacterium]|nr:tRNA uridine-5-carboxymethylaminomethyl(34) synthesis GTPase MnmE [candidate division CSSED10-310 bacterium]
MASFDTIAAPATPPGTGAIGLLRMSGPAALDILRAIFVTCRGRSRRRFLPRRQYLGWIIDPRSGERIDQVLAVHMRAPGTYTGDDTVELSHHGGSAVARDLLDLVTAMGARLAQPGEFTRRAFLNGRLDLAQAEAVAGLIQARSAWARRLAIRQLDGGLSTRIATLRDHLLETRMLLDAAVDFPEEDIPSLNQPRLLSIFNDAAGALADLLRISATGREMYEGLQVAIMGRPNVGKSSLLNRLSGTERAIVDAEPGTTRDLVEATLELAGLMVRVVDTAGLRSDVGPVEREGLRRGMECAARSD